MMKAKTKEQTSLIQEKKTEKVGIKCPNCESTSTVRDHHQNILICKNCGRIIKKDIKDTGPEWRAYDQKEREERTRGGPPITETIHDKGLSTQIDWKNRDSRGKSLSPERRSRMYRLRKWQKSTKLSEQKDRNLSTALSEINRMSSQLGLPRSVREETSKIYRKAVEEDLIRGHSIEGIATATLYLACRKNQIPRTLDEIAEVSYTDKKEIGKNYRYIARELDIHLPPVDPVNYVSRFGSDLGITGEVRTKAIEIIKKAKEKRITSGKGPAGTAAGAIYIASKMCGESRTQKEVADAAGVTAVTLRNRYKEMIEKLNLDLSS
ncbi:transcription initiation factor IIB [candidate division MSBL1 archaeon SCGC-AAA382A13]|uniref:Transcription initiation factor IIB n=1 Tax=candidate division MSBL1 archaeon SCGC-AAA382A13 TaxID=1698279 RepID=A0A133VEV4_9EURY|nr:transcription initiation factor IIB [candidate division MSBL1 archaeon SCGC-AAA382A13]